VSLVFESQIYTTTKQYMHANELHDN